MVLQRNYWRIFILNLWACTLPKKVQNVQVSNTTGDAMKNLIR